MSPTYVPIRASPVFGRKGASVHVQEVIRGLLGHGATVELFATRTADEPPEDLRGVVVHELPAPASLDAASRERELLAQNGATRASLEAHGPFDLVYERHALWSYAAMEYAADSGTPGLLEVNAPLIEEQARHRELVDVAGATAAAARAFRASDVCLAVSLEVAEYLGRETPATKVEVVANGADTDRIRPDVEPSRLGPAGSFTFGFVGTLKPWHGLDTLIDGFAMTYRQLTATRVC